jgi:hypothetical protein
VLVHVGDDIGIRGAYRYQVSHILLALKSVYVSPKLFESLGREEHCANMWGSWSISENRKAIEFNKFAMHRA